MQIKSITDLAGDQVSPEQGRALDALQTEFLALVTKVDAICDDIPPAVASTILYHFCGFGFSFFRLANKRNAESVEKILVPPPTSETTVSPMTVETSPAAPPTATPAPPTTITTATIDLVATPQTQSSMEQ